MDRVEDLQGMNVFRQKPKETLGSVYLIVGRADFLPKHNANASVLLFLDGHKVLTVSAVVLVPAADLDLEKVHRNVNGRCRTQAASSGVLGCSGSATCFSKSVATSKSLEAALASVVR